MKESLGPRGTLPKTEIVTLSSSPSPEGPTAFTGGTVYQGKEVISHFGGHCTLALS